MLSKKIKKDIIANLNKKFNNYESISSFCERLNNDIEKIVESISKIIKYAFVCNYSIKEYSLNTLLEKASGIDELYKEYLNKNRGIFSSLRKKYNSTNFTIPLDEDIDLNDIKELKLPSLKRIKEVCEYNLSKLKAKEEKNKFYIEQMGFSEIGLTYSRRELLTIDPSLLYYHYDLSGNIDTDYEILYNSERYLNNPNNPLKRDYNENVNEIKKRNDIAINKWGNVYEIENGRHRIIYLLKHGRKVAIPVKITRRIEDKEINEILISLKNNYNIYSYKNNILNDEINILLFFEERMYEIKSKEELTRFYEHLKLGDYNNYFRGIPFKIIYEQRPSPTVESYRRMIYQKYLELGDSLVTSDFTEVMKYFENVNNSLFYEAFVFVQDDYQDAKVFGYDFKEFCEFKCNSTSLFMDDEFDVNYDEIIKR